jgi:hypothetical protein
MDYKKYSLEKLEEWVHDALSCGEASPQEIYDVIKKVVEENYYIYKDHTSRCYELLTLLNGNGKGHLTCDKDGTKKSWNDFWEEHYYPEEHSQYTEKELNAMCDAAEEQDKVVKWQLPVEVDGVSGEYYIQFPDDLMEAANINENDLVEWIDRKGGSFELRKVTKLIGMEQC